MGFLADQVVQQLVGGFEAWVEVVGGVGDETAYPVFLHGGLRFS